MRCLETQTAITERCLRPLTTPSLRCPKRRCTHDSGTVLRRPAHPHSIADEHHEDVAVAHEQHTGANLQIILLFRIGRDEEQLHEQAYGLNRCSGMSRQQSIGTNSSQVISIISVAFFKTIMKSFCMAATKIEINSKPNR